jgi:hypothetical protein
MPQFQLFYCSGSLPNSVHMVCCNHSCCANVLLLEMLLSGHHAALAAALFVAGVESHELWLFTVPDSVRWHRVLCCKLATLKLHQT